jgi:simple sugar transport system ATP-binding protein
MDNNQSQDLLLRMKNIVKTFPGTVANDGITFEVREGEVHSLLGENGAGKTVLMSVLFGLYKADSGDICYRGEPLEIRGPKDAIKQRIGMVHQHFMLVPTLSVAQNVILGQYRYAKVLNDMDKVVERLNELSREFGLDIDPNALISDLSVGEQQRVEILKALYHGADLLILDEPTAVLTPQETTHLLKFLRNLVDNGLTIIFITHKLEEVMQVSDRVTVLRDGKVIATVNTAETSPLELARYMVGRDVLMDLKRSENEPGEVVLSVKGLNVEDERGLPAVKDVSFEVRAGEILGVAGVSGNGQTELVLALAGLAECRFDEILLNNKSIENISPRGLSGMGMVHIPEDRHKMGVVLPFTVSENLILEDFHQDPYSSRGFLMNKTIAKQSDFLVEKFDIRTSSISESLAHLSGGNQQKVVVARELDRKPRFMLVSQPTRGIDIGATEFIRQQILIERDNGAAVLLVSTELEEIFGLSDRIIVMYEGEIIGEVPADRSLREQVGLMMAGDRSVSHVANG